MEVFFTPHFLHKSNLLKSLISLLGKVRLDTALEPVVQHITQPSTDVLNLW